MTENVKKIERRWKMEFVGAVHPLTVLTIVMVREKFETHVTVINDNKQRSGRKKTSTDRAQRK